MLCRYRQPKSLLHFIRGLCTRTGTVRSICSNLFCEERRKSIVTFHRSLATRAFFNRESEKEAERKERKVLDLFVFVMIAGGYLMYQVLWYFRKKKFRDTLKAFSEPLEWEDFATKFLAKDMVEALNYQPDFCMVDVYLKGTSEEEIKKKRQEDTRITLFSIPEYALKPDLRFLFDGTKEELAKTVKDVLLESGIKGDVKLYVDKFPDRVEILYMCILWLFMFFFVSSALKAKGIGRSISKPV